jgi:transcriptional regulator with XRE-family HTH domain
MSTALVSAPEFGNLLKDWRNHRRMSQLSLSALSGISQRHISFLETGRSKPSRGMVLALAESLDVPLRERNTLLQAAGFSALYSQESLTDAANEVFREALQATLDKQEPYPALVLDGRWNLIMANNGALNLFSRFLDITEALAELGAEDFQMVRLCLHDAGFRPYIVNWEELTYSFLQRLRRALLLNPRDARLPPLIEEIVAHPDAPRVWREPEWGRQPAPAINLTLEKDGERYTLFTMLAHFGSPQQVTLEELSVELFYPADAETRERLEALGRTR